MSEQMNFSLDAKLEFKEATGGFDGVLVNYNHQKLGHNTFRFAKGSMGINDGKKLHLMYNHNGNMIPVGQIFGEDSENGFNIKAEFALEKDEGGYINREAAALYIQSKKVPFDLSVGGVITKFSKTSENGKNVILIEEFKAHEGSITPHGAIEGSKITKVFGENGGDGRMGENLTLENIQKLLAQFTQEMMGAQTDEQIKGLPAKFTELQEQFKSIENTINTEFKDGLEAKFKEINEVIKGLKVGYTATKQDISDAEAFFCMLKEMDAKGTGVEIEFSMNNEIKNFATPSTGDTPNAIKPKYVETILTRLQAKNSVMARISFLPIGDNSVVIPREMLGLPECGIVGELDERTETKGVKLDNVTINLFQFYCMPAVSNRLLAVNFVGYLNFLMSRVEYAWSLFISDKMFTGTGVNQPKGILVDTNIAEIELDLTVTGSDLADKILEIYYSMRTEIAEKSTWDMTRAMWAEIAKLKNDRKDFYITDLNTGNSRTLMNRPVNIIESDVLKNPNTAAAGDYLITFGYWEEGMIGVINPNLNLKITDQITTKGITKYYMEKLLGFGVQLPENFIKIKKKTA
ncbi:phage major capsid protein [Cetobacterium sp.]|uniref:phage major capsid protein n=1 Tax=Cetobacterium sp. TaxID=2071632 RepID=UPI003F399415